MLNIVLLNGGRGAQTLLPSLLSSQGLRVTSIVNAYDDGLSTGKIREFFKMLGPSDIRKVQQVMLPPDYPGYPNYISLFNYRYPLDALHDEIVAHLSSFVDQEANTVHNICIPDPTICATIRLYIRHFLSGLSLIEATNNSLFDFSDCSLMNCIYAGAFLYFKRDLEQAVLSIDRLFRLRGFVLTTSTANLRLMALRENGDMLYNEASIVQLRSNVLIEHLYLLDHDLDFNHFENLTSEQKKQYLSLHNIQVEATPSVIQAINQADLIFYSPGTQHSSLYPTYMTAGISDAIANNTHAAKIFITNIGADYETPTYKASDYIANAYKYLTRFSSVPAPFPAFFHYNLVNDSSRKDPSSYVHIDHEALLSLPVTTIIDDFESPAYPGRHDGQTITDVALSLYQNNFMPHSR